MCSQGLEVSNCVEHEENGYNFTCASLIDRWTLYMGLGVVFSPSLMSRSSVNMLVWVPRDLSWQFLVDVVKIRRTK